MKRLLIGFVAAVAIGFAGLTAFGPTPDSATAAPAPPQCNDEMNIGGQEVSCTVVIENYIAAGGGLAAFPPSTLTMIRCVGSIDSVTCETTVTTLTDPVTTVQQCNRSGSGGGGAVRCTVSIANHFEGSVPALEPAAVYQCVGSTITGPGAPGTCTPANTDGVTSVGQATVGQCNGSGNGGTNVAFICNVSLASTMTSTLPINIDQCNNSGNGGGAVVICSASVTNDVFFAPETATPTSPPATPTSPAATPTSPAETPTAAPATPTSPAATPTSPAATPTSPAAPAATSTPIGPVVTPPAPNSTPQGQIPPTPFGPGPVETPPAPNSTPQAQTPPTTPTRVIPPMSPQATPQAQVPPSSTPQAPATGESAESMEGGPQGLQLQALGLIVAAVGIGGLWIARRSR